MYKHWCLYSPGYAEHRFFSIGGVDTGGNSGDGAGAGAGGSGFKYVSYFGS